MNQNRDSPHDPISLCLSLRASATDTPKLNYTTKKPSRVGLKKTPAHIRVALAGNTIARWSPAGRWHRAPRAGADAVNGRCRMDWDAPPLRSTCAAHQEVSSDNRAPPLSSDMDTLFMPRLTPVLSSCEPRSLPTLSYCGGETVHAHTSTNQRRRHRPHRALHLTWPCVSYKTTCARPSSSIR